VTTDGRSPRRTKVKVRNDFMTRRTKMEERIRSQRSLGVSPTAWRFELKRSSVGSGDVPVPPHRSAFLQLLPQRLCGFARQSLSPRSETNQSRTDLRPLGRSLPRNPHPFAPLVVNRTPSPDLNIPLVSRVCSGCPARIFLPWPPRSPSP
jgi:hypothetical protein